MPSRWQRLLGRTGHRPWPLPRRPWLGTMAWEDLLFLHWPLEPRRLRTLVPEALALDRHGGRAWVSVAAFRMDDTGLRGGVRVPGHRRFPELNVRTYVTLDGKPGVWFFSLDAGSRLAAALGRAAHLPYHAARMALRQEPDGFCFRSRRRGGGAGFRADYHPAGRAEAAPPGSLDAWLTERYCLYAARDGKVWRLEVHHDPWPLQPVDAHAEGEGLSPFAPGLLRGPPGIAHYARRLDVVAWAPERVV